MLAAGRPGQSCRKAFYGFEGWQTAGLNTLKTDDSEDLWRWFWREMASLNALTTNACGQRAWSKLPRSILRIWGLANGRLERPKNRWPWRQMASLNALTTNACGQGAGSKLPQNILRVWGLANGRLERRKNRWLWRQMASLNALTTNACGQRAWSKLPRSILRAWGLANGRLERPKNRWLWRSMASLNALTTNACDEAVYGVDGWQTAGLNAPKLTGSILRVWGLANDTIERPKNRWPWGPAAGLNALTTYACSQRAWSKLPQSILQVWGLANGRLERPKNRWPCRQMAGLNALNKSNKKCLQPEGLVEAAAKHFTAGLNALKLTVQANGRLERSNYNFLRPEGLVEAAAKHFTGLRAGKRQAWTP